jgi:DNA/RNA-binding domain of Phe-tRNA-synthetase-like protein
MGPKPTQYRCASEALLRRLRKEGSLPRLHPLVDLCNAVSAAYAIPIAVFDLAHVSGALEVRRADGDEDCLAFGGEHERPEAGEVVFADTQRRVHARRWCNRQSAWSAMRPETAEVLIVAEAMHDTAARDVRAIDTLVADLVALWGSRAARDADQRASVRPGFSDKPHRRALPRSTSLLATHKASLRLSHPKRPTSARRPLSRPPHAPGAPRASSPGRR